MLGEIVFGQSQRESYFNNYRIEIVAQHRVGKALDAKAMAFEEPGARGISFQLFRQQMLIPVQLENELLIEADKVDDVGTNRLLTAEFEPRQFAVAQRMPQHALDVGLVQPQMLRESVLNTRAT